MSLLQIVVGSSYDCHSYWEKVNQNLGWIQSKSSMQVFLGFEQPQGDNRENFIVLDLGTSLGRGDNLQLMA